MGLEDLGRRADSKIADVKSELNEGKQVINNMDVKEKKWLKIIGFVVLGIFCIMGLSMCVSSCSKPKTMVMNGVTYPVDQNGTPYQQAQDGQGYVPAPGYINQSRPIQNSNSGFLAGAITGGAIGHLLTRNPEPAPVVPQYQPTIAQTQTVPKPVASTPIVKTVPQPVSVVKPKSPGDVATDVERAKMAQEAKTKADTARTIAERKSALEKQRSVSKKSGFSSFSKSVTKTSAPSRSTSRRK